MTARVSRRSCRRMAVLALAPALLAGCSWQSLGMSATTAKSESGTARPSASSATTPAQRAQASTAAADAKTAPGVSATGSTHAGGSGTATSTDARFVRGALATGSATHRLTVGSGALVLTYWTTRDVASWTSTQPATVQISARLDGAARTNPAFVTSVSATFTPNAGAAAQVLRTDQGKFVITPPYSYGTAVLLPAVPDRTTSADLYLDIELLVETAPHSGSFFRQTVIDTVPFTYSADSTGATS